MHEVNTFLGTRVEGGLSFEQALPPSLFYRDFSDTNRIVGEAEAWAEKDMEQLMYFSSSLLSEAGTYLSLDRSALLSVDFEALFEEHIKPFELRYGRRNPPLPNSGATILQRAAVWTPCLWIRTNTGLSMRNAVRQRRNMTRLTPL